MVGAIVLEEDITQGQRIDEAVVTARVDGDNEQEIARVHCVGYRRIVTLEKPVTATQVRVTVTKSRQASTWRTPTLSRPEPQRGVFAAVRTTICAVSSVR